MKILQQKYKRVLQRIKEGTGHGRRDVATSIGMTYEQLKKVIQRGSCMNYTALDKLCYIYDIDPAYFVVNARPVHGQYKEIRKKELTLHELQLRYKLSRSKDVFMALTGLVFGRLLSTGNCSIVFASETHSCIAVDLSPGNVLTIILKAGDDGVIYLSYSYGKTPTRPYILTTSTLNSVCEAIETHRNTT